MPQLPQLSPWKSHVARWGDCRLCPLCDTRKKIVLARGSLPCDVLFIGEAPGPSEDVIGQPFVGPAGHLLDEIMTRAGFDETDVGVRPVTRAFTNLVACIPKDESSGDKFTEPPLESIKACFPRLVELVRMAKPKLIITVGKLAAKHVYGQAQFDPVDWLPENHFIQWEEIIHPAAILRMDLSQRGLQIQRTIVKLSDALETLWTYKGHSNG